MRHGFCFEMLLIGPAFCLSAEEGTQIELQGITSTKKKEPICVEPLARNQEGDGGIFAPLYNPTNL